jgi:hypothetical protein
MRTVKIERERWDTKCKLLYMKDGCGCIMGLIGEALGVPPKEMFGQPILSDPSLETIGLTWEIQESAIEVNDDKQKDRAKKEFELKELFKDHLILEFV